MMQRSYMFASTQLNNLGTKRWRRCQCANCFGFAGSLSDYTCICSAGKTKSNTYDTSYSYCKKICGLSSRLHLMALFIVESTEVHSLASNFSPIRARSQSQSPKGFTINISNISKLNFSTLTPEAKQSSNKNYPGVPSTTTAPAQQFTY